MIGLPLLTRQLTRLHSAEPALALRRIINITTTISARFSKQLQQYTSCWPMDESCLGIGDVCSSAFSKRESMWH